MVKDSYRDSVYKQFASQFFMSNPDNWEQLAKEATEKYLQEHPKDEQINGEATYQVDEDLYKRYYKDYLNQIYNTKAPYNESDADQWAKAAATETIFQLPEITITAQGPSKSEESKYAFSTNFPEEKIEANTNELEQLRKSLEDKYQNDLSLLNALNSKEEISIRLRQLAGAIPFSPEEALKFYLEENPEAESDYTNLDISALNEVFIKGRELGISDSELFNSIGTRDEIDSLLKREMSQNVYRSALKAKANLGSYTAWSQALKKQLNKEEELQDKAEEFLKNYQKSEEGQYYKKAYDDILSLQRLERENTLINQWDPYKDNETARAAKDYIKWWYKNRPMTEDEKTGVYRGLNQMYNTPILKMNPETKMHSPVTGKHYNILHDEEYEDFLHDLNEYQTTNPGSTIEDFAQDNSSRNLKTEEYNKKIIQAIPTAIQNKYGLGGYYSYYNPTAAIAYYSPSQRSVYLPEDVTESTAVHELTHAMRNKDLENKLKGFLSDSQYYDNPKEIYARLMQLRQALNLDPAKRNYTIDEIQQIINSSKDKEGFDILDRYTPEQIQYLFNEIAYNPSSSQSDIYFAKRGIKLNILNY